MTGNRDANRSRAERERERERRQKERTAPPAWAADPNSPRAIAVALLTVGGSMAGALLIVAVILAGVFEPGPAAPSQPPAATPLASAPAEPAGDGTTAIIATEMGDIVIELFNESSPVAAENFLNLAAAGFYDGLGFHRILPGFMIQGGDPLGTGQGGPGYNIPDEPVVGDYVRGMVAMARTAQPNSQGSQFFILVGDAAHLSGGGYAIFGRVMEGIDVADQIVAQPRTGPSNDLAVDPVLIETVIVEPAP